jgi:large subunit ribosomal protein L4
MITVPYRSSPEALASTLELPYLFLEPIRMGLMHQAVHTELTNRRQGTHATKTRGQVSGGGRKPYRQKGTGRARQGTISAPHYRHGGIVFGPHPRDLSTTMPKKARRAALRSALASKAVDGCIVVVDSFGLSDIKTKQAARFLKALDVTGEKTLILTSQYDPIVYKSFRNIEGVQIRFAPSVSVRDILDAQRLVIQTAALETMERLWGKSVIEPSYDDAQPRTNSPQVRGTTKPAEASSHHALVQPAPEGGKNQQQRPVRVLDHAIEAYPLPYGKGDDMSELRVNVKFRESDLRDLDLPVVIRNASLGTVEYGLSHDTFDLPLGTYMVTATFPSGRNLSQAFDISRESKLAGKSLRVTMDPDDAGGPADAWQQYHYLFGEPDYLSAPSTLQLGQSREEAMANLSFFTGNPAVGAAEYAKGKREPKVDPVSMKGTGSDVIRLSVTGTRSIQMLQIPRLPDGAYNCFLPAWAESNCFIDIHKRSGTYHAHVRPTNPAADALLRFYSYHRIEEAALLLTSPALDPDIILGSRPDPIAACILSYVLLICGDERPTGRRRSPQTGDVSRKLLAQCPTLPDSTVIAAKLASLNGRHDEAFDRLLELPRLGPPIFVEGLRYAVELLGLYTMSLASQFDAAKVSMGHEVLRTFAYAMNRATANVPFLVFAGVNPNEMASR